MQRKAHLSFCSFCKYNVIFRKLFKFSRKKGDCRPFSLFEPLFDFHIYYAREGIAAVVAQVEAAVQVGDCAAWFDARNLLTLVAYGNLLVKVGKAVVEIDGELAVVALLDVDGVAVDVGYDGLSLFYLVSRSGEPIEMLACDKLLSPYNLLGVGGTAVLCHPTDCSSIYAVHPVSFVLDYVVAVGVLAGVRGAE